MADKYGTTQDPYTYPNSTVLVNKLNITNEDVLEAAERDLTTLAAMYIEFQLPPYDFKYFCLIHHILFSDLFDWAGELRTVDISKGNTRFCNAIRIEKEANNLFSMLEQDNYLVGLAYDDFVTKLAEYYCDINVLHPFREGNGRVQRLFFEHIAINCGYNINFSGITAQQWIDANIHGYHCNYEPMKALFTICVTKAKKPI
ncbi:putative adenosine monophosphate-protein transferase Fic [Photobacterium kishitanii]|uniref:putative adenosine monophosphate-protein transferase Fic n=1 Tax=Photobacterium kishitanii TaxID=318456 RepID=UPI0005D3EC05|nr:putative adenosine monophosphate-protein transferase Fic [Photobacterium kishitanii]KJG09468.1 cell division protein Fic [Photobacterium kishitanii]PSV07811.1 putative adenosine monophosphate-protein transferase Fic [Photobacterium kishitanii]PSV76299.1 putative adenosine monophosphate-protein transferase Fic [Photobacterium kishitanii]PSW62814.1 putative adenosine monophosphate-protein transferase Fic [Photobacterium kishitanii]